MRANKVGIIPVSAFLVAALGIALAAPAPSFAAESPASAPAAAAEPAAQDKPKRAAAKRAAKAAPEAAAAVPAAPVIHPKYNDVMTPVLMQDYAGAAEILQAGAWADRADRNGETPLMLAARRGDPKMTALLLKHGANPNRSGPEGNLHAYAGIGGSAEVVKLITNAGGR
jgi:ankyrin repeat protein